MSTPDSDIRAEASPRTARDSILAYPALVVVPSHRRNTIPELPPRCYEFLWSWREPDERQVHCLSERPTGSSPTGELPLSKTLRTDSVNRGNCISLRTLEIVVRAVFVNFFFVTIGK